ncbi:hypothetical protein THIOKS1220004 [Thiocapsa sp. KS1]|nr:hypothetical protein THIOKS1220004 [Thiocapsa sp. KS1]
MDSEDVYAGCGTGGRFSIRYGRIIRRPDQVATRSSQLTSASKTIAVGPHTNVHDRLQPEVVSQKDVLTDRFWPTPGCRHPRPK